LNLFFFLFYFILEWGADCVNTWYLTSTNYDFKNPYYSSSYSKPFTQLVWSASTSVGFAMAASYSSITNKHMFCCVAKFSPAGNVNGSYVQNVKPYNASAYIIPTTSTTTTATTTTTLADQTLPAGCLDAFRKSILDRANFLRVSHNALPLKESDVLRASALKAAAKWKAGESAAISKIVSDLRYTNSFAPGMGLSTASDCARKIEFLFCFISNINVYNN
jgi:hypothetical protein